MELDEATLQVFFCRGAVTDWFQVRDTYTRAGNADADCSSCTVISGA